MEPIAILIADDDEVIRRSVRNLFSVQRFATWTITFHETKTLAESVELVERISPDITIIDLNMDQPDTETIKSIFEMSLHSTVIVMTGDVHAETEAAVFAAGAEDYVRKTEMECFENVVMHSLQRHRATDRLRMRRALRRAENSLTNGH